VSDEVHESLLSLEPNRSRRVQNQGARRMTAE
jgi:hypothetical protein